MGSVTDAAETGRTGTVRASANVQTEVWFWAWLGCIQLLIAAGAIVTEASTHPEAVAIGATGILALSVGAACCWHAGRLRGTGGEGA